jgi:hypothetical protein
MSERPKEPNFETPPGFLDNLKKVSQGGPEAKKILYKSVLEEIGQAEGPQRRQRKKKPPTVHQDHGIQAGERLDSLVLVEKEIEKEGDRHVGQRGDPDEQDTTYSI